MWYCCGLNTRKKAIVDSRCVSLEENLSRKHLKLKNSWQMKKLPSLEACCDRLSPYFGLQWIRDNLVDVVWNHVALFHSMWPHLALECKLLSILQWNKIKRDLINLSPVKVLFSCTFFIRNQPRRERKELLPTGNAVRALQEHLVKWKLVNLIFKSL